MRWLVAVAIAAALSLPATDPLTSGGAQNLDANFTSIFGANSDWITNAPGTTNGFGGADYAAAYWNADSFTSNQYSQVVLTKGPNGYEGVGVNFQGSGGTRSGYFVTLESGCTIHKWVSGTRSDGLGSCSVTWTDGHTLKMANSSGTITVYDNGTPIGTYTDSGITGGSPGIMGYTDTGGIWTTWQGDNVGGGGATFPAALINGLVRCCQVAR